MKAISSETQAKLDQAHGFKSVVYSLSVHNIEGESKTFIYSRRPRGNKTYTAVMNQRGHIRA